MHYPHVVLKNLYLQQPPSCSFAADWEQHDCEGWHAWPSCNSSAIHIMSGGNLADCTLNMHTSLADDNAAPLSNHMDSHLEARS